MENLLDVIATQPWALVIFAVVVGLIFGVRYLGLWQGQTSGPKSTTSAASVVAMVVDPTALNNAAEKVGQAAAALNRLADATNKATEAANAHARNAARLAEEVDRVREEIRVTRESAGRAPRRN